MWSHRNTIVHGETVEAAYKKELDWLFHQVEHHYEQFHTTPSYVLPHHAYLFESCTLLDRKT